jgi:hypothetical protein
MKLELLDTHQVIGIDFDGTLVNNPRSHILQQYILDNHQIKDFHIVTFRTHNLRIELPENFEKSVRQTGIALKLEHFKGVHCIPDVLFERKYMFDDGTEYYSWKAKQCQKIGATVLLDDMIADVGSHCNALGVVCLDPNEGYIPEPGNEMDTLIEWLREDRGQYGECKGLLLDELYRQGRLRWYDHENSIIANRSWPPPSDFCWVELYR